MNRSNKTIIIFTLAVPFLLMACLVSAGGPNPPTEHIEVSPEQAVQFEEVITQGLNSQDGSFAFTLSETQITSYLAYKLPDYPNPFTDIPQVILRSGQIEIYGVIQQSIFIANAKIVVTPIIDIDGKPTVEVTDADFGMFPAPDGLLTTLSSIMEESFNLTKFLDESVSVGYSIESINIDNGLITISGNTHTAP